MTVHQLIEVLEQAVNDGFGDCEVMLATQPNYPLASTLKGVGTPSDLAEANDVRDQLAFIPDEDALPDDPMSYSQEASGPDVKDNPDYGCVWLIEDSQRRSPGSPYAPRNLW